MEAIRDPQTWAISLPIAAITFLILRASGVFAPSATPAQADAATNAASPTHSYSQAPAATLTAERSATPALSSTFYSTPATEARAIEVSYAVARVRAGDALNVRSGPDSRYPTIERLSNGFGGIRVIGSPVINGTTGWVKISFAGRTGWVNRDFLEPESQ